MSYTTLSGRISTDPYQAARNFRPNYDWYELPVRFQDATIADSDITFDYRAIIEYDDEGHHRVLRFEICQSWTAEEIRRGVAPTFRQLTGNIVDSAIHVLCSHHFETDLGQSETHAEIEKDQRRRDEEYDLTSE